jgi:hypothetical protein
MKLTLAFIGFAALLVAAFVCWPFVQPVPWPAPAVTASPDRVAEARAASQKVIQRLRLERQRLEFELYELELNAYERKHGLRARLEREAADLRHPERMPWNRPEYRPDQCANCR